jgi:hypothetical protein
MRMSTSVLAACAAAVIGLSGVAVAPASAAPLTCSDLQGVLGGQDCVISDGDPGYSLNISYPVDYPDGQTELDWVKQTRDGFVNVAKMPDARLQPYQLVVTPTEYSSSASGHRTQSLVFKVFQDVGGAHPQTFFKAFNWDQVARKPIQVDTGGSGTVQPLFKPGANPWPVIFPLVLAELEKQLGAKPTIAPEVGLSPSTYDNFALDNDSLVFFFGQGAILPESAGALTVTIPRGPVDAMIA